MPFLRSISMPRSGHHYVWKLLQHVLQSRLDYHLRAMPDPRTGMDSDRLVFWKTHDSSLDVPLCLPGARTMVQWREPVGLLLSEAQRKSERSGSEFRIDDPRYRLRWLASQVAYYTAFKAKWIEGSGADLAFDYARLISHPQETVAAILSLVGYEVNQNAIEDAVNRLRGTHADRKSSDERHASFAVRIERSSDLIPANIAAEFERACLDPAADSRLAERARAMRMNREGALVNARG